MNTFRIIHMSDLHYTKEKSEQVKTTILPALLNDIKSISNGIPIDLICFSGDIISMGGHDFGSAKDALEHFSNLLIESITNDKIFNSLSGKFSICPGNHEVERKRIDSVFEKGIKATLKEKDGYEQCLSSYENNPANFARIEGYKSFEDEFYKQQEITTLDHSNFQAVLSFTSDVGKIGVLSLNSVWRSIGSNDDYGSLLLSIDAMNKAPDLLSDCDIRIALMHHHFSYYHVSIRDKIESILHKNFDIVLSGHSHYGKSSYVNTLSDSLIISIAPNLNPENQSGDSIAYSMGYTIIDYDNDQHKCRLTYRRYCPKQNAFIPNLDIVSNGFIEYNLPDTSSATEIQKQASSVRANLRSDVEILNEHLLSSMADTNAPKSLDTIFVEPPLTLSPKFTPAEE